jgi:hypothetical protein
MISIARLTDADIPEMEVLEAAFREEGRKKKRRNKLRESLLNRNRLASSRSKVLCSRADLLSIV